MGQIQIPFGTIFSARVNLADPESGFVSHFLSVYTQPIDAAVACAFSSRSPKGYGVSLFLSHILKVK